ncbi:MAG: DUF418 domain-containing protein [Flavisolibacter sp.]
MHTETLAAPVEKIAVASPVAPKERIAILDSLRGIAILGILLMNIPGFGLTANGFDPFVLNENSVNYNTWYFVQLFPDGTQRALFSMLFGAGIILFVRSAEKKVDGIAPADYFFRRQIWLFVFALIDIFAFLWLGDILLDYALYGMFLFTFRKLSPKSLLIGAGVCLLLMLARENRDLFKDKSMISKGEAIEALKLPPEKLTLKQKDDLGAYTAFKERGTIAKRKERLERAELMMGRSNYKDLYEFRTDRYIANIVHYTFFSAWDVLLFMLLGMAFFKMGILTGKASSGLYWWMFIIGSSTGILLAYLHLQPYIAAKGNAFEYTKNAPVEFYQLQRLLRSLGLFGLIMLLYKSNIFKWFFELMRPVGRMAFTNYLMQSIICGLFFYSVGFGMMGKLERHELYYVVGAVWIFQIIFCNIWLRYYQFGPFEWAWRSLTYWQKQPMRK